MRIGLRDIDPNIATQVAERLNAPLPEFLKEDIHWGGLLMLRVDWRNSSGGPVIKRKRAPAPDEQEAYNLRKRRGHATLQRAGATIVATGAAALVAAALPYGPHGDLAVVLGASVATMGALWTRRIRPTRQIQQMVTPVEMRSTFALLRLSRAERIYCDTLLLLANLEIPPENEQAVRETLGQLNDLLATCRSLERRRLSLLPVMGSNTIDQLTRERAGLQRQLDSSLDPLARHSIEQSIRMCEARVEAVGAFEQGLDRLRSQEEALVQTLSSAQAALARMHLVSQPHFETLAHEIADSVSTMNRQTYAVEQAVQEVLELRAG